MSTILYTFCAIFAGLAWLTVTGDWIASWLVGSVFVLGVAFVIFMARTEVVEADPEAADLRILPEEV